MQKHRTVDGQGAHHQADGLPSPKGQKALGKPRYPDLRVSKRCGLRLCVEAWLREVPRTHSPAVAVATLSWVYDAGKEAESVHA